MKIQGYRVEILGVESALDRVLGAARLKAKVLAPGGTGPGQVTGADGPGGGVSDSVDSTDNAALSTAEDGSGSGEPGVSGSSGTGSAASN